MQKQVKTKTDKLTTIKQILNGTFTFPFIPKIYFVEIANGVYTIEWNLKDGKRNLTETEYQEWKALNVRECDKLWITELSSEEDEIQPVAAIEYKKPITLPVPELTAIEKPVMTSYHYKQIEVEEAEVIEEQTNVVVNRGMLSKYGEDDGWKLSNDIIESQKPFKGWKPTR